MSFFDCVSAVCFFSLFFALCFVVVACVRFLLKVFVCPRVIYCVMLYVL